MKKKILLQDKEKNTNKGIWTFKKHEMDYLR